MLDQYDLIIKQYVDNFVKLIKEDLVVHDMFLEVYKGNGFLDNDSYLILNNDNLDI